MSKVMIMSLDCLPEPLRRSFDMMMRGKRLLEILDLHDNM